MALNVGVIAEEQNDIDVLYEITCKLILEKEFSFSKFAAHGCGKLRKKCKPWSQNLIKRGCKLIVIMHDLDDNDVSDLRNELEKSVGGIGTVHLILIPIHEIEAWLLSDPVAIKQTFHMKKLPRVPLHPETILKPKEHLRDIVWKYCKKHYINTIHNKTIANQTNLDKLSVCPSFLPYPKFIEANFQN